MDNLKSQCSFVFCLFVVFFACVGLKVLESNNERRFGCREVLIGGSVANNVNIPEAWYSLRIMIPFSFSTCLV